MIVSYASSVRVSEAECEVFVARVVTFNTLKESQHYQAHLCQKYIKQHLTVLTNDISISCRTAGMESILFLDGNSDLFKLVETECFKI